MLMAATQLNTACDTLLASSVLMKQVVDLNKLDLAGQKFDEVLAVEEVSPKIHQCGAKAIMWKCLCSCGNVFECSTSRLRGLIPKIKSCGCKNFHGYHHNRKGTPAERSYKALHNRYKQTASKRGIEFRLSESDVVSLFEQSCYYCGRKPSTKYNVCITISEKPRSAHKEWMDDAWIVYNGIDRIDNSKGYTTNNTVPCCKTCNYAKLEMSLDDFLGWIGTVYKKWYA